MWRVKCAGKNCSVSRTFSDKAVVSARTVATSHALRMGHVVRMWNTSDMVVETIGKDETEPLF